MKIFFWQGPATNLGRFGPVKKGSPLLLTDGEARYVTEHRDRNYRAGGDGEKIPKDISDQLRRQNDPESVKTLELNDCTFDELVEVADQMRDEGYAIGHKVRSSRRNVLCAIQQALRNGKAAKQAQRVNEHATQ